MEIGTDVRKKGILLPVFSLPGKYGIGSLGEEAYRFVDFLAETGQDYWQVLPLGHTSYGDSPYQALSAFAGNPYFIDPEMLLCDGLLTAEEVRGARSARRDIDYASLYRERYPLLRKAYSRFTPTPSFETFKRENEWLGDYVRFMSLKEANGGKCWREWTKNAEDDLFWAFVQFEFFVQWRALKSYANRRGVKIIGDVPIYVAYDSAEVWAAPRYFRLEADGTPEAVAGVPPDAFTEDGQLWGNPLYRWEVHEEENFAWWCRRLGGAFRMYDVVRLDHFRGFAAYYSVPYGETTARRGTWEKAPGSALFLAVKERFPEAEIIAEDLGYLDGDVRALLEETGFPGMKIAQFGFGEEESEYNPKRYPFRCVAYTGTHDNLTSRSWAKGLPEEERAFFRAETGKKRGETDAHALVRSVLASRAQLAVIPLQDYLGLGAEGRVNTPSTVGKNWIWRLPSDYRRFGQRIGRLAKYREGGRDNG